MTLARPSLLCRRCINNQDAFGKHEAELAHHFERVDEETVNIGNQDVGCTLAQLSDVEAGKDR